MIIIVNGKIGTGKTYGAVAAAVFKQERGRQIALNWEVNLEGKTYVRYDGLNELDDEWREKNGMELLRGTDIYCDEAHKELGARDWEKLTPRLRNSFSESRKDDNNLIFVSQDYKFLDVYVRRLAEEVWTVGRMLCWTYWLKAKEANPETGELKGWMDIRIFRRPWHDLEHPHPFGDLWELWKVSKKIAGMYDTHRKIANQVKKHQKKIAAAPPAAGPQQQDILTKIENRSDEPFR
jgi:Zonular occludens toxin (Zot)